MDEFRYRRETKSEKRNWKFSINVENKKKMDWIMYIRGDIFWRRFAGEILTKSFIIFLPGIETS